MVVGAIVCDKPLIRREVNTCSDPRLLYFVVHLHTFASYPGHIRTHFNTSSNNARLKY
jgi:hypothetical protein